MKVLVPLGTRPEIVKLAPVVTALRARRIDVRCVGTGQQADPRMSESFFADLGLAPDHTWVLEGDASARYGAQLANAHREVGSSRPDAVVLLGDTNTVPMFCLAARSQRVPVVHLEAGLRSYNETSLEEVNRRIAAACASLHLAPTDRARQALLSEGLDADSVYVVGNPVIDALRTSGVSRRAPGDRRGILFTAHRATNVDDRDRLGRIVELAVALAGLGGPVDFPVHPRTESRLRDTGLDAALRAGGVRLLPPLPYPSMLRRLAGARVVVTDSGGIQEEAAFFGVPVVVLRRSTPRWEGVDAGLAVLTGLDVPLAISEVRRLSTPAEQDRVAGVACPYGDGHTGTRVADLLGEPSVIERMCLREPSFVTAAAPC